MKGRSRFCWIRRKGSERALPKGRAFGHSFACSSLRSLVADSSDCREQFCDGFSLGYDSSDQLASLLWDLAAGKHDYWSFRSDMPHCKSELVAIHFRHMVIEEHRIKTEHRSKSQSLSRGCGCDNDVSRSFEQRFFVFQNRPIIIDTEEHSIWALIRSTHWNLQKMGSPP